MGLQSCFACPLDHRKLGIFWWFPSKVSVFQPLCWVSNPLSLEPNWSVIPQKSPLPCQLQTPPLPPVMTAAGSILSQIIEIQPCWLIHSAYFSWPTKYIICVLDRMSYRQFFPLLPFNTQDLVTKLICIFLSLPWACPWDCFNKSYQGYILNVCPYHFISESLGLFCCCCWTFNELFNRYFCTKYLSVVSWHVVQLTGTFSNE